MPPFRPLIPLAPLRTQVLDDTGDVSHRSAGSAGEGSSLPAGAGAGAGATVGTGVALGAAAAAGGLFISPLGLQGYDQLNPGGW